jgi:hypothetical protein
MGRLFTSLRLLHLCCSRYGGYVDLQGRVAVTIAGCAAGLAAKIHAGQAGVGGIGTVFLLMALVAAGATFGYAATRQDALAALRFSAAADDALDRTGHVLVVSGPMHAQDVNGDGLIDSSDALTVDVIVAPGSTDVDLAATAVFFVTGEGRYPVAPTIDRVHGDGDSQLEPGELVELRVAPPAALAAGESFTVELTPADGPPIAASGTLPPVIDPLMTLY